MTTEIHPRTARRARAALSLLAVVVLCALPVTVSAAGNGAAISGTQLAYGTCGENSDGYWMTGDLVGCWYITTFESTTDASKHNVRATGTELFDGWIGSLHGTFTTTFVYTAKMDGPWGNFLEIHGRCHHPIVEGTGDFAGITGELSFKDVVDVNPPYYPYWGNVRIPGGATAHTLSIGTAGSTSRSASTTTTGTSC